MVRVARSKNRFSGLLTLREKQSDFLDMVSALVCNAGMQGTRVCILELYRSPERQKKLVAAGKSKTYNSKHLRGLAVDIGIVKPGGVISWNVELYRPLGDNWKALGGVWGGDFSGLVDAVHFEYKEPEE